MIYKLIVVSQLKVTFYKIYSKLSNYLSQPQTSKMFSCVRKRYCVMSVAM